MTLHLTATWRRLRDAVPLLWTQLDSFTKRRLSIAFGLMVLTSALATLPPLLLGTLVDHFNSAAGRGAALLSIPMALVLGWIMSQYLAAALGVLRTFIYGRAQLRMRRQLNEQVFLHVLRLPMRMHLEHPAGAIGQIISLGIAGLQIAIQHTFFTLLPLLVGLIVAASVLAGQSRGLYCGLFAASAVIFPTVYMVISARVIDPARSSNESLIQAYATLTDSLMNYEIVKCLHLENTVSRHFGSKLETSEADSTRLSWVVMYQGQITVALLWLMIGIAACSACLDVMAGTMTAGVFVVVVTYMMQAIQPLDSVGSALRDIVQATVNLEKMVEILKQAPEPDVAAPKPLASVRGELRFENVTFGYDPQRPLIRDLSFSVPAGHMLGVVGWSGSGKTTLIRLLFRLFPLNAGRILIDGMPITELSLEQLRESIAIVPQDTVLFRESIGFNIAMGRPGRATFEDIRQAAKVAQLDDFIMGLPERYETKVGERGLRLSGGERQRVAIARAVLRGAKILVFDEATSALDARTEHDILASLHELAQARTTLVIAHRLATVAYADNIIVMHDGHVAEQGSHADLLAANGRYAALYHAQHRPRLRLARVPTSA